MSPKLTPFNGLKAAFLVASLGLAVVAAPAAGSASEAHKLRSAHFLKTALESKGLKVEDVRRKGQMYLIKVTDGSAVAILAIDGYSAEIVGVTVVDGKPEAAGSGPHHFTSVSTSFGYTIEESSYESITEVSETEMSSTESFTEESFVATEEVDYAAVDSESDGDLDEGTPEDAAGDAAADEANDGDN